MQHTQAQSSYEVLRAVRDDRALSPKARLLVLILASHGTISVYADLIRETGLSKNSVTAAKKEAIAGGWLVKTHSGRGATAKMRDTFDVHIPSSDVKSHPEGIDPGQIPLAGNCKSQPEGFANPTSWETDTTIDTPEDANDAVALLTLGERQAAIQQAGWGSRPRSTT